MEAQQLENTLATVCELLQAKGMSEAENLVRVYPILDEQTGYDNWNGGTEVWEIFFEVPTGDYAHFGPQRESNWRSKLLLD